MNLRFTLAAVLLYTQSLAFAGSTGYQPQPVSDHTGTPISNVGPLSMAYPGVEPGGAVVVSDSDGSYYVATTNKITKFNASDSEVWVRECSYDLVHVNPATPEAYTLYYEDWGGGNKFQAGSGTDAGEVMGALTPQKGLIVGDSVVVVFSDTSRPYRALVVRFDEGGDLLWRHPTSYPLADISNAYYETTGQARYLTDLFVVSGMTGVVGIGVFESVSFGQLYLMDSGTTLPAARLSRVAIFKLDATNPGGNGEYLLNPVQFGSQQQHCYGVGATLRHTDAFNNYVVLAMQEGPSGSPIQEADKLVFRVIHGPFTSVSDVVYQFDSVRAEEEWNDVEYRHADDNLYLAGTSYAVEKPRQLAASFTADDFVENWTEEIVPDKPFYVSEFPTARGAQVFVDDGGVTVAAEGIFALGKVDFEGNQLWTVNFLAMEDGGMRRAYSPVMDSQGSIFYTGVESQTELRIWKVSSGGIFQYQSIPFTAETDRLLNPETTAAALLPGGKFIAGMPTMPKFGSGDHQLTLNIITDTAVVKAPNEITVEISTGGFTYRGNSFTYQATATSGLPVTLSIVSGTATVDGSKVTFTTAGNVKVRFSQPGNDGFEAAAPVDVNVEVRELAVKAHQTISFSSVSTKEFSLTPFSVNATASSRLAVTYSISGPASISGNKITLKGLGTVKVTAKQAGNGAYLAASSVTRSFVVRDTTKPKVSKVDTSATSTKAKYSITGAVSDNHRVEKIQYRIKAPGGTFEKFKSLAVSTAAGGEKRFSLPINVPDIGKYVVELFAEDESGNKGSTIKVTINRK